MLVRITETLIEVREKIVPKDKIGARILIDAKLSKARPLQKLLRFSLRGRPFNSWGVGDFWLARFFSGNLVGRIFFSLLN